MILLTLSIFVSFALLGCGGTPSTPTNGESPPIASSSLGTPSTRATTNIGKGNYYGTLKPDSTTSSNSTISSDSTTSSNSTTSSSFISKDLEKYNFIEGIDYACGTKSGKTDKNGIFFFEKDKECKFSLAGVTLRTISADKLKNDGGKIFEDNSSVTRLLQSIDADGNLSNGIEINDKVLEALTSALDNIDDHRTVLSDNTVLKEVVAEVKIKVETISGLVRREKEVQEDLTTTETEITKALLSKKIFYVVVGITDSGDTPKIQQAEINKDVTEMRLISYSETKTVTLEIKGNKIASFENSLDKVFYPVIKQNGFIKIYNKKRNVYGDRLYDNKADAQKYFDSLTSSISGDLAKLLAGKTVYKSDNHNGEKTITTFVFNQNMTKLIVNETYTFDITTTNDRFTFNFESKKYIYKIVGKNSDYLNMHYLEDEKDEKYNQYRKDEEYNQDRKDRKYNQNKEDEEYNQNKEDEEYNQNKEDEEYNQDRKDEKYKKDRKKEYYRFYFDKSKAQNFLRGNDFSTDSTKNLYNKEYETDINIFWE